MTDDIPPQSSGLYWGGKPIEQLSYEEVKTAIERGRRMFSNPRHFPHFQDLLNHKALVTELKGLKTMYEEISISPARMG